MPKGQPRSKFLTLRDGYHGDTLRRCRWTDPQITRCTAPPKAFYLSTYLLIHQKRFWEQWDANDINSFKEKASRTNSPRSCCRDLRANRSRCWRYAHLPSWIPARQFACCVMNSTSWSWMRLHWIWPYRETVCLRIRRYDVQPDILCVGKAPTGGHMTSGDACE